MYHMWRTKYEKRENYERSELMISMLLVFDSYKEEIS